MAVTGGSDVTPEDVKAQAPRVLEQFSACRVLIVDDEPANVALLTRMLLAEGLRSTYTVTNSHDVLEAVADSDPDLVLLDLHMPGVDGYELLTRLRQRAAGAYLPVLVLTADTSQQAITRALNLGARDFLTKPFDMTEVCLRVRNLLETRSLHTTLRHHNLQLRRQVGDYQRRAASEEEARQTIIDRLDPVLAGEGLSVQFQPVREVGFGTMVGCEALARFSAGPIRGPELWFADAQAVGLGPELEMVAVAAALRALPRLPAPLFLAINVSPATVMSGVLTDVLSGADCRRVVLELTEHVPIEDYSAVVSALAQLREHGIRVALDDTGAGYAGFRHLLGLQPDVIKLDISLTRDIDHDVSRRALAAALVAFAGDVGAQIIAEGVETEAELETLGKLGVPWVQGYFLGRPQELDSMLK
jgi:EAL domain-containing protein (putative c-di-GMP-specific phosphodiesterase class I)